MQQLLLIKLLSPQGRVSLQFMKSIDKPMNEHPKHIKEDSIGWVLNMLTRTINSVLKKKLEPLELTQMQLVIIMTLLEEDGLSQAAIGKKTIMPGYAMTRNLDALERRKLIERRPDESSRRSFCIVLTKEGRALAPSLFQTMADVHVEFLSGLQQDEIKQLKFLLRKLMLNHLNESHN